MDGWLVIDKPVGMTSMAVTQKVRRALEVKKAGHGGTLDPFATGVLPIALGRATKTASVILGQKKMYQFTIAWGLSTTTGDWEGEPLLSSSYYPSQVEIEAALPIFTGNIEQVPHRFSALKVQGVRAYKLARAGKIFTLQPRPITIYHLILLEVLDPGYARFEVICSAGTYVRVLGEDLAHYLGTEGHLKDLRRVRVGPFQEKDAISLDILLKKGQNPKNFLYSLEDKLGDILASSSE